MKANTKCEHQENLQGTTERVNDQTSQMENNADATPVPKSPIFLRRGIGAPEKYKLKRAMASLGTCIGMM